MAGRHCRRQTTNVALTERTLKIVCLEARGRCAAPGCKNPVLNVDSNGEWHVLGEIAHIVARSANGPRGNEEPEGDRDGPGNLLLLCRSHHAEVDGMQADHPTTQLREWKRRLWRDVATVATLRENPSVPWSVAHPNPSDLVDEQQLTDATPSERQYALLKQRGAVDLNLTRLELTLYNPSASPVLVRRIFASVSRASPSPLRARLQHPTAGAVLASVLRIDLNDSDPTAYLIVGEDEVDVGRARATKGRTKVVLEPDELCDLVVEAFTSTDDVEWFLCLDVVQDGTSQLLTLGLGDKSIFSAGMPAAANPEVWLLPGIAGPRLRRAREYEG